MRFINFETRSDTSGGVPRVVADRIEDVRIASALLAGASASAEEALAVSWAQASSRSRGHVSPPPSAAGPLRRILAACNEFERALAGGFDV
jgi:hypothetical protein